MHIGGCEGERSPALPGEIAGGGPAAAPDDLVAVARRAITRRATSLNDSGKAAQGVWDLGPMPLARPGGASARMLPRYTLIAFSAAP